MVGGQNAEQTRSVDGVFAFDVTSKTWSTLDGGVAPVGGEHPFVTWDDADQRLMVQGLKTFAIGQGLRWKPWRYDIAALETRADSATWALIDALGRDAPLATADIGSEQSNDGVTLFAGRSGAAPNGTSAVWKWRFAEQDFVQLTATDLPESWGWARTSQDLFIGAASGPSLMTEGEVWRCAASECTPMTTSGLSPRVGAISWRCSGTHYAFGGWDPSGVQVAELNSLACTDAVCDVVSITPSTEPAAWGYVGGDLAFGLGVVIFGGGSTSFEASSQLLRVDPCAPRDVAPLTATGTTPGSRVKHTFTYGQRPLGSDLRDRMYLFGGTNHIGFGDQTFSDVQVLELEGGLRWVRLDPAGEPPVSRASHVAAWDRRGSRLIVYGGVHAAPNALAGIVHLDRTDLWELRVYE